MTPHGQFALFGADTPETSSETAKHPATTDRAGPPPAQNLTPIARRIIDASASIQSDEADELAFSHTVLCQTSLPYRQHTERHWQRTNGRITLEVAAGRAYDPRSEQFENVALPYGARARLVLMHLNARALKTGKAEIEVEDSLTAFVRNVIGRDARGHDITAIRNQLTMLAASTIRLGMALDGKGYTVQTPVIVAFDLWAPDHAAQKVLWPSSVRLGGEYFESLVTHAVPLDQRAIAALGHSAVALDIYAWLAQRLHRIPAGRGQFIPWTALHEQFGQGYTRLRAFRATFLKQLHAVHTQYPTAQIEVEETQGIRLRHSPPPVPPKLITGPGSTFPG